MEIGVFSFCVRFIIESYICHPSVFVCTQLFHGLGSTLFWVACISHAKNIASKEVFVTTFAVVTGVYHGLAGLVGNMAGGLIYHEYGGRTLFMSLSIMSGVWTIVMVMYYQGSKWFTRRRRNAQISSDHEMPMRSTVATLEREEHTEWQDYFIFLYSIRNSWRTFVDFRRSTGNRTLKNFCFSFFCLIKKSKSFCRLQSHGWNWEWYLGPDGDRGDSSPPKHT